MSRENLHRFAGRSMTTAMLLLLSCAAAGCFRTNTTKSGGDDVPASHQRMGDALREIADRAELEHLYTGDRAARELRAKVAAFGPATPVFQRVVTLSTLGQEELNIDNIAAAIESLEQSLELFPQLSHPDSAVKDKIHNRLLFTLGTAYMRLAETQNCCAQYTGESCIVPIRGAGIHTDQEGAKKAIACFREILERPTEDKLEQVQVHEPSRWLMNIAYMTIGGYPDDVPADFVIAPEYFESKIDFPRFENIYPKLGLDTFNLSGGAIIDDFNNDGYLDIFTTTYDSLGQTQYFENDRDGTFSEKTHEVGLDGIFGGLNAIQADYDNDGDLDVFIPRGAWLKDWGRHPNSLLRNDGGTFTDVTFDVGLGDVHYPCKTAAWADYDNDGDLDLYIGNESSPGEVDAPAQLFRNDGGKFVDIAQKAGLKENLFAMGAVWGDYDADRYPDLFVSNGGANRLYHNNRDGTFTDVAEEMGVTNPQASFPTWFWDFDNDGTLDLYVGCSSGHVGILALQLRGEDVSQMKISLRQIQAESPIEMPALYRGIGKGRFVDVAKNARLQSPTLPMGANFGDLNNDGFLDFYLGTGDIHYSELMPNLMYLNMGGTTFENVTMSGGFGHLQKGHAVSFADLDNDGDQDVYMQMGGAYMSDKFNDALYENPGFDNHWLTIQLVGTKTNRCAIGARIHVVIDEDGSERSIYRHVTSGGSFGCNPLRQAIGLGQATIVRRLEVYWPTSDTTQTFEGVVVDRTIRITEGSDVVDDVQLRPLTLGGK